MGYRSDVRIILKTEDYKNMLEEVKKEDEDAYYKLKNTDVFEYRQNEEYIYIGWNSIKWYDFEGFASYYIETKMKQLKEYWFARIGEDYEDIEEVYNLSLDYKDDGIYIIRQFED